MCSYRRLVEAASQQQFWLVGLWWAAQVWITRHVWLSTAERLAKTEK